MNLLSGYDLIVEFSKEAILKLVKAMPLFINDNTNPLATGRTMNPPFQVDFSVLGGNAKFICESLDINLISAENLPPEIISKVDSIVITMNFDNSSFSGNFIIPALNSLHGELRLTVPINLTENHSNKANDPKTYPSLNLAFSKSTVEILNSNIPDPLIIANNLRTLINKDQQLPLSDPSSASPFMSVLPGVDGMIQPTLQFERLDIRCTKDNNENAALCLCGILIADNHDKPNTTPDFLSCYNEDGIIKNDISLIVSPEVVCKFIMSSVVQKALNITSGCEFNNNVCSLPKISVSGIIINSLNETLRDGANNKWAGDISFTGQAYGEQEDDESVLGVEVEIGRVEVWVDFSENINLYIETLYHTVRVEGSTISYTIEPPDIHGIVANLANDLGLLQPVINSVVDGKMATLNSMIQTYFSSPLSMISPSAFNFTFNLTPTVTSRTQLDAVYISSEGIIFTEEIRMPIVPINIPVVEIDFINDTLLENTEDIIDEQSGVFVYNDKAVACKCGDGSQFHYKLHKQKHSLTFQVFTYLLADPVTIKWFINGILCVGENGNITIPNVTTNNPTPNINEGIIINPYGTDSKQNVTVEYNINNENNTISIININGINKDQQVNNGSNDNNFFIDLSVIAVDLNNVQLPRYSVTPEMIGWNLITWNHNGNSESLNDLIKQCLIKKRQCAKYLYNVQGIKPIDPGEIYQQYIDRGDPFLENTNSKLSHSQLMRKAEIVSMAQFAMATKDKALTQFVSGIMQLNRKLFQNKSFKALSNPKGYKLK